MLYGKCWYACKLMVESRPMAERYIPQEKRKGTFQKGDPRIKRGRTPGVPNKLSADLKKALEGSACLVGGLVPIIHKKKIVGWKPTGKGGLEAYLCWLAVYEPRTYAALWARAMPYQISAQVKHEHDHQHTVTTRFAGVDPTKLTPTELQAALREAISLTKPLPAPMKLVVGPVIEHDDEEAAVGASPAYRVLEK